jgi:GTP cyclohydrolase II
MDYQIILVKNLIKNIKLLMNNNNKKIRMIRYQLRKKQKIPLILIKIDKGKSSLCSSKKIIVLKVNRCKNLKVTKKE